MRQTLEQSTKDSRERGGAFTYVGSPMQNIRLDVGDTARGALLYYPNTAETVPLNSTFATQFVAVDAGADATAIASADVRDKTVLRGSVGVVILLRLLEESRREVRYSPRTDVAGSVPLVFQVCKLRALRVDLTTERRGWGDG